MKNSLLIVIASVVTVGALLFAFFAFEKQNKLGKSLEEEKYGRLVAEESSQKSAAKLAALEVQLRSAEDKMSKVKDVLDQEKGVNSDLKSQYEKLEQAKTELENKVKELAQQKDDADKKAQELAAKIDAAALTEAAAVPAAPEAAAAP